MTTNTDTVTQLLVEWRSGNKEVESKGEFEAKAPQTAVLQELSEPI